MPYKERKRAADEKELQKSAKKCKSLTGYLWQEHFFDLTLIFLFIHINVAIFRTSNSLYYNRKVFLMALYKISVPCCSFMY